MYVLMAGGLLLCANFLPNTYVKIACSLGCIALSIVAFIKTIKEVKSKK